MIYELIGSLLRIVFLQSLMTSYNRYLGMKYICSDCASDKPRYYDSEDSECDIIFAILVNVVLFFITVNTDISHSVFIFMHWFIVFLIGKYFVKCLISKETATDLVHITISDFIIAFIALVPQIIMSFLL